MSTPEPLAPDALYKRCDPGLFSFETTAELADVSGIIGQNRAIGAVHFGVNIQRAIATGLAGVSIEDSTGDAADPLFDFDRAVARVRAARAAIDRTGPPVVLTARSEGFIVGRPDLDETVRRLVAFADAGADCLYAPGIRTADQITAVVRAVAPRPVNVLVGGPFATVPELAALGVRRISVGGALARVAWTAAMAAAREVAEQGTFSRLGEALPHADVDGWFTD